MQHVKGFYIDAKEQPETLYRHATGIFFQCHGMVLDMVDRRVTPSVLVGRTCWH